MSTMKASSHSLSTIPTKVA